MHHNPAQFLIDINLILYGLFFNPIDADIDFPLDRLVGDGKGQYIGVIIVLQSLVVEPQYFLVIDKNIIQGLNFVFLPDRYIVKPAFDFQC